MHEIIKVGIVEDDVYIRDLVVRYLAKQPDMNCMVIADSAEDFFDQIGPDTQLDVLIQDIGLPGITGLEALRTVKQKLPRTEILMFSVFDDAPRVFKAFCAGASGYLLKNTRLDEIRKSIINIHQGMGAMSPSIARMVVEHFQPQVNENPLSEKENMVVQLLTEGMSYKMVADRMQISMNTVRSHIRNIYSKLHVNSKAEVIAKKLKGEI